MTGEAPSHGTTMSPVTAFFATLTGVYGGYFGAGSGVMMVAVLGLGLDLRVPGGQRPEDPRRDGRRTWSPGRSSSWSQTWSGPPSGCSPVGSVVGGYVGPGSGGGCRRSCSASGIVVAGVIAAVTMLT